MKKEYYAIFEKDDKSCFTGYCPDYPGVLGAGDSLEEAVENMAGAIEFYLEDGDPAEASSFKEVEKVIFSDNASNHVRTIVAITVKVPKKKARRINITMIDDLADKITAYIETHEVKGGISGFLSTASRDYLRRHRG